MRRKKARSNGFCRTQACGVAGTHQKSQAVLCALVAQAVLCALIAQAVMLLRRGKLKAADKLTVLMSRQPQNPLELFRSVIR